MPMERRKSPHSSLAALAHSGAKANSAVKGIGPDRGPSKHFLIDLMLNFRET